MEINKGNVIEVLEKYLKEQGIRFNVDGPSFDSNSYEYELLIGSTSAFIIVDFVDRNDFVYFQFDSIDDRYSNYGDTEDEEYDSFNLEEEIDNLVTYVKDMNKITAKISSKIEAIKEICEENDLDYEDFISINYDFD